MKEMYKAFIKKLFGAKYERLKKTLLAYMIVFWGLHAADLQIQIAPTTLYLAVSTLTAGVMWQALSSCDNSANMKNLFMLPFGERSFTFAYVSALGAYTVFTKTVGLLAAALAVSSWNGMEIFGSILCTVNAVLMTACVYAKKRNRKVCLIWIGIVMAAIFLLRGMPVFFPALTGNIVLAVLLLSGVDAYSFYLPEGRGGRTVKSSRRYSVWRYLLRYLTAHKNYLTNTIALWGIACVLPLFLGTLKSLSAVPIGFAILSLNTPLCILLSCDPALEQAVRFLPKQKKTFLIPYCSFLFLCNMAADMIFLCSWQIQIGGVTIVMILAAVFFALLSAAGSVLLEWFYPIRNWKIESDLWHHPRKYIVPAALFLLAGIVGMVL
ncbi:MAG: hypothetical protein K2G16_07510 [Lachnospiraceae bacterium]|nr:hypothetical protein [Lachnospiraceae bacterium]